MNKLLLFISHACVKSKSKNKLEAMIVFEDMQILSRANNLAFYELLGDAEKIDNMVSKLKEKIYKKNHKVCGISWKSSNLELGAEKSLTLKELNSILLSSNKLFLNLQYGETGKEIKRKLFILI